MPDLQEVFRVTTQKVRPDPGALERQVGRQRRRVRRRTIGALGLVLTLMAGAVVVGFAATRDRGTVAIGDEPTLEPPPGTTLAAELEGIWANGFSIMARFDIDGTFAIDDRGNLGAGPAARGTYEVSGDTVRFTNVDGVVCPAGDEFAWRVDVMEDGRLQAVFTEGGCSEPVGSVYNLVRVSPESPAGAGLNRTEPGRDAASPELAFDLHGIWLRQGTGELLSIGLDGTYSRDDGGLLDTDPDDAGRFAIDRGTITFTSGARSQDCSDGDRVVWRHVRIAATTLRAELRGDDCRGDTGDVQVWLLVSSG